MDQESAVSQAGPERASVRPGAQRRLRLGLCSAGFALVTIGAVCLLATGGARVALPAFSSIDKNAAHESAQCQACLGRIQRLQDTERDALSTEIAECRRVSQKCADTCTGNRLECRQECAHAPRPPARPRARTLAGRAPPHARAPPRPARRPRRPARACARCKLDEYKCSHDATDSHRDHLGASGHTRDQHECHAPCGGLSAECQSCIDDVHYMREQGRAQLAIDLGACDARLGSCFTSCEKNDKRCKLS